MLLWLYDAAMLTRQRKKDVFPDKLEAGVKDTQLSEQVPIMIRVPLNANKSSCKSLWRLLSFNCYNLCDKGSM